MLARTQTQPLPQRIVAVVTGASGTIGQGIVETLFESFEARMAPFTVVLACRSRHRAEAARAAAAAAVAARSRGRTTASAVAANMDIVVVDLARAASVFRACADLRRRYRRIDMLVLNAGIMPVASISLSGGLSDLLIRPAELAKSGGNAIVQRPGLVTAEGLGEVFAANVFGHFIMIRELEQELARSGDARIVWMSSTTAQPESLSLDDWQCIKGSHPYESSKRLCELVSIGMHDELNRKGIHSFIASPGNVNSGITQGAIFSFLLYFVLVILRLIGLSGINISGRNGATSTIFLCTIPSASDLDYTKVFHSEINVLGRRWVVPLPIHSGDPDTRRRIVADLDTLYRKFRDLAISEGIVH